MQMVLTENLKKDFKIVILGVCKGKPRRTFNNKGGHTSARTIRKCRCEENEQRFVETKNKKGFVYYIVYHFTRGCLLGVLRLCKLGLLRDGVSKA